MIVTIDYITEIHAQLVENHQCFHGVRDENLLISAIDGQNWHDDPIDQIIHVAYSVCANHVYNDGNKRTSFLVLKLLEMKLNLVCDWSNIAQIVLDLATHTMSKIDFENKIKENIL